MRTLIALMAAIMLCLSPVCLAQQNNWDEALDRYELICERCLELMDSQKAGADVPRESLSSLMVQLSMLKNSLSAAEGSMSASQKARFELIRRRFAGHSAKSAIVAEDVPVPVVVREPKPVVPKRKVVVEKPETNQAVAVTSDDVPAPAPFVREWAGIAEIREFVSPALAHECPAELSGSRPVAATPDFVESQKVEIFAAACCSVSPAMAYGAALGFMKDNWGAYVSGRTGIASLGIDPSYECSSSGRLVGGGMVWSSGERVDDRTCLTAGGIVRLSGHSAVYADAGWGSYDCFVEDVDGGWARVTDLCGRNVAAEAGVLFFLSDRILIGAGMGCIGMGRCSAELCLGLRFGRH